MKDSEIENDLIENLLLYHVEEMSCIISKLSDDNKTLNKKRNSLLKEKAMFLSKEKYLLLSKLKRKLKSLVLNDNNIVIYKLKTVAKMIIGRGEK